MNIQRGLVKDLGYDDTECTYVTGVDDVQYYFVNGTTLGEGLYVVTPNVKEAVGHEVYSTLGVIDENASLIIPCVNKRIELVADRFLLVEKTEVESNEVKASLAVKDDPVQANTYNNDSLNIKRAMENQMGPEGVFIFDDMFSEANLYDFSGNKILGDEFTGFSFIGQVGNDLYLHTININDAIKVIKTPTLEKPESQPPIAPAPDVIAPTAPETSIASEVNESQKNEDASVSETEISESVISSSPIQSDTTGLDSANNIDSSISSANIENNAQPQEVPASVVSEATASAAVSFTPKPIPTPVPVPTDTEIDSSAVVEPVKPEVHPEDKYLDPEDAAVTDVKEEGTEIDSSRYDKYILSAHEKPDVKNAVYDEAVEVIRSLMEKNKRLENDSETKGVRIKELELDNKDFAKTIKNQRERIEKLEKDNESHVLEIRKHKKNIETLETEKREYLRTIESQNRRLQEQENKLKTQDEELSKHESGKQELVKLLEDVTEVLD